MFRTIVRASGDSNNPLGCQSTGGSDAAALRRVADIFVLDELTYARNGISPTRSAWRLLEPIVSRRLYSAGVMTRL